ncbi:alpha/beta hydrolase [Streptomyces sasae]|uniref:alpha/beta hydrolase n=1 Tax=Streptomyces sasae TaxID=1266772 RepID=UPI00292CF7BD|nr:alpha/beta hydrolase [Streptomyces sasae]
MQRRIPRYTPAGVADAAVTTHPFTTEDGLGLCLTRFRRFDCDDVVVLLHGLTASSDLFIMPEHRNMAGYLLDNGFGDVWTLDMRMSNRFPYNTEPHRHTLDDVALYDYPAALAELRRHIGDRRVHVVAHCLGSMTFLMSLFGDVVRNITSVVVNAVGLVMHVPTWSRWKLDYGRELIERVIGLSHLDPRFDRAPALTRGRALARLVSLAHPECDNPACHMVSFMWGSGWPALYSHANLDPVTHDRIADLLGPTGLQYHRHIRKIVRAGRAVKYDSTAPRHASLPDDYLANAEEADTPVLFLTGDHNNVFGDSCARCHRELTGRSRHPDRYELYVAPGYGYLDCIIGKNAHLDVFPHVLDFLRRRAV